MSIFEDKSLLYQIAKYYYLDELSQQEICEKTQISRAQISRLLKKARELGIVKIDVIKPENNSTQELSEKLKQKLPFKEVYIMPDFTDDNSLYLAVADFLSDYLLSFQRIGIGWNRYLYNIALHLKYQNTVSIATFYPLVGSLGVETPFLQVNNIADRFAEHFKSNVFFNNHSVLINKDSIDSDSQAKLDNIANLFENLDCAIVGIGGKKEFNTTYIKELPILKEIDIKLDNVYGGILTHFFYEDESICMYPDQYHINVISLQNLQKIPSVIGICFGVDKVEALYFGVKNQFYNILITDESTGLKLLERCES